MNKKEIINQAFDNINNVSYDTFGEIRQSVEEVISSLDSGKLRVACKTDNSWQTKEWVKKAILLYFRLNNMQIMNSEPVNGSFKYWDKIPLKTSNWTPTDFKKAGFRAVPGSIVRKGAFIAKDTVLMPCFINIGAFVDTGTMVDTWSTIGSCAQIGKNVHISGGVGIGGVLEPLQAQPTIIEDNCFIGARSEVAEGVIVEKGSVLAMGVFISASTKIVDRASGTITIGRVPAGSVVVPGTLPSDKSSYSPSLYAAVIVKTVDEKTLKKVGINNILRESAI